MVLDLGCGFTKRDVTAIGVDRVATPATGVITDLSRYPWPFRANTVDRFLCFHIIEHVPDIVGFMKEIHRVGRPGATLSGEVPHFLSPYAFTDPTHAHFLCVRSFDMFCDRTVVKDEWGWVRLAVNKALGLHFDGGTFHARGLFRKRSIRLEFPRLYKATGFEWVANCLPEAYEVASVVRAPCNLCFELEVLK